MLIFLENFNLKLCIIIFEAEIQNFGTSVCGGGMLLRIKKQSANFKTLGEVIS